MLILISSLPLQRLYITVGSSFTMQNFEKQEKKIFCSISFHRRISYTVNSTKDKKQEFIISFELLKVHLSSRRQQLSAALCSVIVFHPVTRFVVVNFMTELAFPGQTSSPQ